MNKWKHIWRFMFCDHSKASFYSFEKGDEVGFCRWCWFVLEGDQE